MTVDRSIGQNFNVHFFLFSSESDDGEAWYYSCPAQFELLLDTLDSSNYEVALCQEMFEFKEEIIRQMNITEKITNQAKGNRKSYLEVETCK